MKLPNQNTLSKRHPYISTANSKAYEKNSEKESTTVSGKGFSCFATGGGICEFCGKAVYELPIEWGVEVSLE